MKRLVIAEKGTAAGKIAAILSRGTHKKETIDRVPVYRFSSDGHEYAVMGLRGHIVEWDYPKELSSWEKVDPQELIWAQPVRSTTQGRIVKALKALSRDVEDVIVATDYDREGELIGVEALDIIREVNPGVKVLRARFSALTPAEVNAAFSQLKEVDYSLARSAESRQLIDLAWGATLTRLISTSANQVGNNYLSIGRVQSPTLALIVEREERVESFVPKPFWTLKAAFRKGVTFTGEHERGRFWEREEAEGILQKISGAEEAIVLHYDAGEKRERPPAPFNTTSFLTEATKLGLSAYRAMSVAEDLYNRGFISYPRTDNTVYPQSLPLKEVLRKLTASGLGKEAGEVLSQKRIRPSRGKKETTDHPPIHPVEAASRAQLKGNRWKVYELVVRRFLATLAPDSRVLVSKAALSVQDEEFLSEGSKVIHPGWRRYYPYASLKEVELPPLVEGESVQVLGVEMQEGETKPPPRYTQGTLIQEMERKGLGTKATRHEIVQKLYDRNYIQGSSIKPTLAAKALVTALKNHAGRITEPEMTSHLEEDMVLIARGEKDLEDVVRGSREILKDSVSTIQEHKEEIGQRIKQALREQRVLGPCVECGSRLVIRHPRGRHPFVGCENYPECRVTFSLPRGGSVEPAGEVCEVCSVPMVRVMMGRKSEARCINSRCSVFLEKNRLGTCPSCGGDLLVRYSRNSKRFAGCSSYPKCNVTYPLPQRGLIQPLGKSCESCGSPVVRVVSGRRPWTTCINLECPSKQRRSQAGRPQTVKGS
ncbi:MAG: DNA topoisomerase I [Thermoplasmata archaeon]